MNIKITGGVNPDAEVIPADKRGRIIDTPEGTAKRRQLLDSNVTHNPRLAGKRLPKDLKEK